MCILFIYNGAHDGQSDYKMILISNRDELYDRPTQNMSFWSEDPIVVAGRGKIVADYVKNNNTIQKYVEDIKLYTKDCNGFVFVSVEFSVFDVTVFSYSNTNDQLTPHNATYLAFSNSLPDKPLKKAKAGKKKLEEICNKFNKESMEKELVENLIEVLKSEERHLPDEELQARQPNLYKELSSIYVCIPKARYGTRTHTIIILTKKDHLKITELTQQMPINPSDPIWEKTEFNFAL